ncbi:hypothetical protein V3N99_14180 [Dermatophilaceae bacterium Soc4.6]
MSSPAPATGVLRLARAGVLTLATVSLSLAAHVAAGGSAPGLVGLLLVVVPVLAATLLTTGRRLGLTGIGSLVAITQVGLHSAFMALTMNDGMALTMNDGMALTMNGGMALTMGGGAGAVVTASHHSQSVITTGGAVSGPSLVDLALSGGSPAMTGAHVVAAGLVALILARGEAALWSLWSWLAPPMPVAARLGVLAGEPVATGRTTARSVDHSTRPRPRGPPRRRTPAVPAASLRIASA